MQRTETEQVRVRVGHLVDPLDVAEDHGPDSPQAVAVVVRPPIVLFARHLLAQVGLEHHPETSGETGRDPNRTDQVGDNRPSKGLEGRFGLPAVRQAGQPDPDGMVKSAASD